MEKRYADLLLDYCLAIREGERLLVRTSFLAEPLVKSLYRGALERGAIVNFDFTFEEQNKILFNHAKNEDQLAWVSPQHKIGIEEYDAYLVVRAPYNLREDNDIDGEKLNLRSQAMKGLNETYFARTASGDLKRSLCQYPTRAAAQEAGMSIGEYTEFVYQACGLFEEDPQKYWLGVREQQQHVVDFLNRVHSLRYVTMDTDIRFSVKDRTWINSDGRSNMPSGEVFSAPVEDSVSGHVYFSYPAIFRGASVEDIRLKVEDGLIVEWDASTGKAILDQVFAIEGARRFGEVAIGTNYKIQRPTKNILFDEKIGGSIHMAVGQSYLQNGGKNKSAIHWDMITDMRNGGQIFADDRLIYEDGKFLI